MERTEMNENMIEEFFQNDGADTGNSIRRSVLLALERDMAFCVALPGAWMEGSSRNKLQLTDEQYSELLKVRPTFTVISLFCSAIDVMARVSKKQKPPVGKNGAFFKECAQNLFELTSEQAEELWNLRNGISHSYRLMEGQRAVSHGSHSPIQKNDVDGKWEFYLHAMYTSLTRAKRKLYEFLTSESEEEKRKTEVYLEKNGFFYTVRP